MAVVHESDVRSFLQATLFVQRARAAKQRIDAACSRLGEDAAQLRREVDTASALERQTELEGLLEAAEAKGRRIEEEREALAAQLRSLQEGHTTATQRGPTQPQGVQFSTTAPAGEQARPGTQSQGAATTPGSADSFVAEMRRNRFVDVEVPIVP